MCAHPLAATDDDQPSDWSGIAAGLILLAAALTVAGAVAAIGGAEALEANVREIEGRTGLDLYASLSTWGWILMIAGIAEATAAISIWRRTPNRILIGLAVAYFGLVIAFFTLVILRGPGAPTIGLLLAAIYVLSYRSGRRPGTF